LFILKGIWAVSFIASILILGFGVQDVYAPDEQPEKLNLGGNGYNNDSGNFELQTSSMYGIATAAGNTTFEIVATLTITDANGHVGTITHTAPIVPAETVEPGSTVPLQDILIPWSQDGSYSGTVSVEVNAHLTKNGNKIGNSEASRTDSGIVIGQPNTPPTIGSVTLTQDGDDVSGGSADFNLPIECIANDIIDPDGPSPTTFTYEWLRTDGTLIATGSTLPALPPGADHLAGETMTCKVTPFDGTDFGEPASQTTFALASGLG